MGATEREAEPTIETICSNFFLVSNLRSFEFTNCSEKSIIILDLDEHPVELTYCTFRSVVSIIKVDDRVSGKNYLPIVLHLPHNLVSLSLSTGLLVAATVDVSTVVTLSSLESNTGFQLDSNTDDMLDDLGMDDIRLLVAKSRKIISSDSPSVVQSYKIFSTPASAKDTIFYLFEF